MKLYQRYNRLSIWNKLFVLAAVVTFISFLIAILSLICNKFHITIDQSSHQTTITEFPFSKEKQNKFGILNDNDSTFSFVDYYDNSLVSRIEEITKYRYSKNSHKNNIEITYSGKIIKIKDSDLYYYPGGMVIIIIDGKEYCHFDSLVIEKTLTAGNPYDVLQTEIENRKKNLIKKNINLISNKIKEYLY